MRDIVLYGAAATGYLALALHFWKSRWRPSPQDGRAGAPGLAVWERGALLVPLALHGWLIVAELFLAPELRFGFAQALSVMLWLGVAIYWAESLILRLDGLEPLILPPAAVAVALPALFPGLAASGAHAATLAFKLHLALAMLAYSLFTIAMLHAVLMAVVERRLHPARHAAGAGLGGPLAHLPPLLTLERLLFHAIAAAFLLLTLTLATGFAFSEALFGRAMRVDHKTVFAIVSWGTFALLLGGRWLRGWRGRTALRWTLAGFVFLMLAYVGSRFVLEVVLGRG